MHSEGQMTDSEKEILMEVAFALFDHLKNHQDDTYLTTELKQQQIERLQRLLENRPYE